MSPVSPVFHTEATMSWSHIDTREQIRVLKKPIKSFEIQILNEQVDSDSDLI